MQNPNPKWFFKIGAAEIAFPVDGGDIQQNRRLLLPQFPQLRFTSVYPEDAQFVNGKMLVEVILPPVKTNG